MTTAEYKQVTVLFADVVHSMDLAAAVGAERLREIMAELVRRAASIVQRYGGKIDKFTGDGIMALFGAPVALEDHAVRACVAALGIQEETAKLAVDVKGARRNRPVAANRPEFRSGDRRRIGFGAIRLTPRSARRSEWRSGWNRQRHQAGSWSASRPRGWWTPPWCSPRPSWFTSRAPTRPCLRGGCWRRRNVGTSADRNRRRCSGAHGR